MNEKGNELVDYICRHQSEFTEKGFNIIKSNKLSYILT